MPVNNMSSLLHFKRHKPCYKLDSIADEVGRTIPATSVLFSNTPKSVDFYDREDVQVGRLITGGPFFEWHKVKKLPNMPDGSENSYTPSDHNDSKGRAHYAIKQVNPKNFTSSQKELVRQAVLRLVLEAKYMSRLDHPHILQAKGLPMGEEQALDNGTPSCFFIVTYRVVETLEDRLARWRQYQGDRKTEVETFDSSNHTFREKLRYAKELAAALAYLHERNLALLNLSPQTVGFLENGTLQITDLSCCQEVEDRDSSTLTEDSDENEMSRSVKAVATKSRTPPADITTNYLMQIAANGGVPRHVAPEVLLHDQYTTKADTYSWSLVLFELLTLSQPYSAHKTGQHLMKVCVEGQRPNLSVYKQLPKDLKKLVCRSWSQSAYRRPPMSKILAVIPNSHRQEVMVANPQA